MNGVSVNNLISTQAMNTTLDSRTSDSTINNQSFSSLLAERMSDVLNEVSSEDVASIETASDAENKKEMIMNLCLMMCSGGYGSSSSLMMNLISALGGSSEDSTSSTIQSVSSNALIDIPGVSTNPQSSASGSAIVDAAMTRLGDPYSTSKRGTGNYVDCSSLAQWAYDKAGISIPSTSVTQAKYCYDNGFTISKSELQPGDLVFWSKNSCDCGRWKEIHHVGIYAGDNKVVEAKGSTGGVVLDDIWGENGSNWKIEMYARPGNLN